MSEEFVDLEARVRNFERHEAQLLGFMGKAQKVADLVSLESELARVRGKIERLRASQVSLVPAAIPVSPDSRLARAWLPAPSPLPGSRRRHARLTRTGEPCFILSANGMRHGSPHGVPED